MADGISKELLHYVINGLQERAGELTALEQCKLHSLKMNLATIEENEHSDRWALIEDCYKLMAKLQFAHDEATF